MGQCPNEVILQMCYSEVRLLQLTWAVTKPNVSFPEVLLLCGSSGGV